MFKPNLGQWAVSMSGLMAAGLVAGCNPSADAQTVPTLPAASATAQMGQGQAYQLTGTQVWDVPDPVSGRSYQVFVSLPSSYETNPNRTYPVLYVTDAAYGFPLISQIARRMNLDGPRIEDFILVGLSYGVGDDPKLSRNRDYTPSSRPNARTPEGGGPAYQTYLKTQALPFIDARFRTDPQRRMILGHSFGSLLATQILFSEPDLFSTYVLGSPSLWFNGHQMFDAETQYAAKHSDLRAQVFMYIGEEEIIGPGKRYDMVSDNRRLAANLKSRAYPSLKLQAIEIAGEDHLSVAPIGFMRALEAVLPAK